MIVEHPSSESSVYVDGIWINSIEYIWNMSDRSVRLNELDRCKRPTCRRADRIGPIDRGPRARGDPAPLARVGLGDHRQRPRISGRDGDDGEWIREGW